MSIHNHNATQVLPGETRVPDGFFLFPPDKIDALSIPAGEPWL
jgi:hypothetical protein